MFRYQQNDNERGSSTEEQRESCSSPIGIQFHSNDTSRNPPLLLPGSHQDNPQAIDIHERAMPPLPFEEGSESSTKKNKKAIRKFVVRRKEFICRDQSHHSKQKSPISSIGYAAVNPKYLFRPI
eukprot:285973_1